MRIGKLIKKQVRLSLTECLGAPLWCKRKRVGRLPQMTLASFRASGESLTCVAARKTGQPRRIPIGRKLGHNWVGTEHLVPGLARHSPSPLNDILQTSAITLARVRDEVLKLLTEET